MCSPWDKIPQSYLDKKFMGLVQKVNKNNPVIVNGKKVEITLTPTPQGRNSIPNKKYPYVDIVWDEKKEKLVLEKGKYWDKKEHKFLELTKDEKYEYMPVGALWDPNTGQRCEGECQLCAHMPGAGEIQCAQVAGQG